MGLTETVYVKGKNYTADKITRDPINQHPLKNETLEIVFCQYLHSKNYFKEKLLVPLSPVNYKWT